MTLFKGLDRNSLQMVKIYETQTLCCSRTVIRNINGKLFQTKKFLELQRCDEQSLFHQDKE